ncbi:hypothetical protein FO519_000657 [Halicephalobus sp. NKZ332]|nr:hypothetical protein FO519_000657 [Halicephalobus sp. NKZ332]
MRLDVWDIKLHKRIFHVANAIFWILGWGSFGIGIWLYLEKDSYSLLAPSSYSAMSTAGVFFVAGVMVIIVAVIGSLGVWVPKKFLLVAYICVVCLLLFAYLTIGIMGYFEGDSVRERVKYALHTTINRTHKAENYAVNQMAVTWDEMQSALECCGVESYKDWFNFSGWPSNKFVPDSCCIPAEFAGDNALHNCGKHEGNSDKWFHQGCHELFTDWLLQHTRIIGIFSFLFITVEIIILFTSVRIFRHIKAQEKQNYFGVQYRRGEREPTEDGDTDCRLVR